MHIQKDNLKTNEKFSYRDFSLVGTPILGYHEIEGIFKFKEGIMLTLHNAYRTVFFLFLLICAPMCIYSDDSFVDASGGKVYKKCKKLSYYLYIEDFINSFIEIPTSNVSVDSSTISSNIFSRKSTDLQQK